MIATECNRRSDSQFAGGRFRMTLNGGFGLTNFVENCEAAANTNVLRQSRSSPEWCGR